MKRLYRSTKDRRITGLCGGIGDYIDVDSTVIRLVTLVGTILSGVLPGLFLYVAASLIVPKGPR